MMPRNATPDSRLKPRQQAVLERLLAGETVTAAARAAKVDRSTVHRWLKEDYTFGAAYNQGRRELQEAAHCRLLSMAERAIQTVVEAIEGGDVRTAVKVLEGLGFLSGEPPALGPEDVEGVELEAKKARQTRFLEGMTLWR